MRLALFLFILGISIVVVSIAGCKKTSGAKESIPAIVDQKSVDGIPLEQLLGDFIYSDTARCFKLTLLDDRTYFLEKVFRPGFDDERVIAKTSGIWSIEKSLVLLTPASTEGNDVFGDFVILDPEISKEGQVSFSARLKDEHVWDYIGFLRPNVLFYSPENTPNKTPLTTTGSSAPDRV
jgi:hypothetical protein